MCFTFFSDWMMDSMLFVTLIGICWTGFVSGGCPTPQELPMRYNGGNVFLCARIYEHSHHITRSSCWGHHHDIYSEERFSGAKGNWWNDRVSSVVVRPGCYLDVYEHTRFRGSSHRLRDGIHKNLPDIGWNDRISSWSCLCEYTNVPLTCQPRESYRTLKSCHNVDAGEMLCDYRIQKGMTIGNSVTNGRSVSETVEASVQGVFKKVLTVGLKYSRTTTYDWSQTRSDTFSTVVTHRVTCDVPVGRRVELRQVVGQCGDTEVFTGQYECRGTFHPKFGKFKQTNQFTSPSNWNI